MAASLALAVVLAVALPGIAHAAATLRSGDAHPAASSRAGDPGPALVASLLLRSADLPAGFQLYAPLNGPLDAKRARALGWDISDLGPLVHTWVRDWRSANTGTGVLNMVFDMGLRERARNYTASFDTEAPRQGFIREPLAGKRFTSFRQAVQLGGEDYVQLELSMARGPYSLVLIVVTPVRSAASGYQLMSRLAAAQSHKAMTLL